MTEYTLIPKQSKSIAEFTTWHNTGEDVITVRYWRDAKFYVNLDIAPVIDIDGNDGINLLEYFKEEYNNGKFRYELDDCYYSQVYDYPINMRRKRKERLDDLWEEKDDLQEDDWNIVGNELWVYSEIIVEPHP